jgi:hypothetical protein
MALLGKRPTKLLALMLTAAALACAAVLLADSAPANAAKKTPLVITDVSPEPGAMNVPLSTLGTAGVVQVTFNQPISTPNLATIIQLINVNTGQEAVGAIQWDREGTVTGTPNTLLVVHEGTGGTFQFQCGTTYEVIVSGHGKSAIRSTSGARLSEVLDESVTFKSGIASWTFTTVACA